MRPNVEYPFLQGSLIFDDRRENKSCNVSCNDTLDMFGVIEWKFVTSHALALAEESARSLPLGLSECGSRRRPLVNGFFSMTCRSGLEVEFPALICNLLARKLNLKLKL